MILIRWMGLVFIDGVRYELSHTRAVPCIADVTLKEESGTE